jgi:CheY-like chemotaxis protein
MPDPARVLVIEDEESIGEVIVEVLGDDGYEVRRARNGREALDVVQFWPPAIIVLDLIMPIMDGRAFRDAQQRLPGLALVPVILLSGSREVEVQGDEIGAVAAIEKPFDIDRLLDTVRQWTRHAA